VRGGAGQATVYGTAVCVGSPYVEVADGIQASVVSSSCSDSSELRISFSIPASAASGSHELTVTTSAGSGTGTFEVYDPTPAITGVDPPDPWEAGGVVSFTIYGTGFGASPTLAFSGVNVGSSNVVFTNDTTISGWVDLTYASEGDLTITVTSNGYSGQSFAPAPQNGSTGQRSTTAEVFSPPYSMVVIQDYTTQFNGFIERDVIYQVKKKNGQNAGLTLICETVPKPPRVWTCPTPPAEPTLSQTLCTQPDVTSSSGTFMDRWSMFSSIYPSGCGFENEVDTWFWKKPDGQLQTLGVLRGYVHEDQIVINNVVSPAEMPSGTVIPKN
jgi:hypothetical protein